MREREAKAEVLRQVFTKKVMSAAERLLPAVTPVLVPRGRTDLEVVGSGVLLRIGPSEFLVTAAHVMDLARGGLHIGGQSTIVHVAGQYSQTLPPDGSRLDDRIDIALVPLADRETAYLRDAHFLSVDELEISAPPALKYPQERITMMLGYPASRQERTREGTVSTPPLYYLAIERRSEEYAALGWEEQDHLLVQYDKKQVRNAIGEVITAPDPYGMSGGGVFRIVDSTRLIAIGIEYLGKARKTVVATRVRHVIHGLRLRYPHLSSYLPAEGAA